MPPAAPLVEAEPDAVAATAADDGAAAVEAELLEIFITEAQDVLAMAAELLPAAQARPEDQDTLARLRRGFHTLKGSGRMVGLAQFADAAAAIEKCMNLWLAEAKAATPALLALLRHAHDEMAAWVDELALDGQSDRDGLALAAAAARVQEGGEFAQAEAHRRAPNKPSRTRRCRATCFTLPAARGQVQARRRSRSRCRCITSTRARPTSCCACWPPTSPIGAPRRSAPRRARR